jgi:phosphate transport system substrate-binding protein
VHAVKPARLAAALVALAVCVLATTASASPRRADAVSLTGMGSSFVAPLMQQWVANVGHDLEVGYAPLGSGAGIAAITNRTVDFGASDAPLTPHQFSVCGDCVQIPWALSATSIAYHVNNLHAQLRLTGPVIADIFMHKITRWNHPRIKRLNPGASLPDLEITAVHRSDSSGTTFNFSDYLSSVSSAWRQELGRGTVINWQGGSPATGSSGVAAALTETNGSIGYVDVAYSLKNHLSVAAVANAAGMYQRPGLRAIAAAASTVKRLPADNGVSIVNPPKRVKRAYPICTFTWVILPIQSSKAAALKTFVSWALTSGQAYGPKLCSSPYPRRSERRPCARWDESIHRRKIQCP